MILMNEFARLYFVFKRFCVHGHVLIFFTLSLVAFISFSACLRVLSFNLTQIAKTFREKAIPCDVIWMDIDYMDGFRCFTFDQVGSLSTLLV